MRMKPHVSVDAYIKAHSPSVQKELARFETSKGTVRFPLGTRIPHALIAKIVRFRVKQVREKN